MKWIDAHAHYQDARLGAWWEKAAKGNFWHPDLVMVNATHPGDWDAVARLAARYPWIRPSYGVHPWWVREAGQDWEDALQKRLAAEPEAGIGEAGLDRWKPGWTLDNQLPVFRFQVRLAAELNRPLSLHGLRAWEILCAELRSLPRPDRGFLVHAYGGSWETARSLARLGARFSFSTGFIGPGRERKREIFVRMPLDWILVETDAPAMAPHLGGHVVEEAGGINQPENLRLAYQVLAELRGMELEQLGNAVERNVQAWLAP